MRLLTPYPISTAARSHQRSERIGTPRTKDMLWMLAARHDNVFRVPLVAAGARRVNDFNKVTLACLVATDEASAGHHMTTHQAAQAWCPAQNRKDSLSRTHEARRGCQSVRRHFHSNPPSHLNGVLLHGVAWARVACNGCATECAFGIRETLLDSGERRVSGFCQS